MAAVSLARRHRTVERGSSNGRADRSKRSDSEGAAVSPRKNGSIWSDITRHKGFRVEYCHINDEYVATIKDTDFMEAAKSIDKAIEKLSRIVKRKLKSA